MAIEFLTVSEIEDIESLISEVMERIGKAKAALLAASPPMDGVHIHSSTVRRYSIPKLAEWSMKLQVETVSQVAAHKLGVESRAQANKRINDRRKELHGNSDGPSPRKKAAKKRS